MFDTPEIYLPEYMRLYARYHPRKLALVVGDRTDTWGELEMMLCRVARALHTRGIQRGDRVAVLAENSLEAIYAELGILKLGASVASLSGSVSMDDLGVMLADAEPTAIFVSQEHAAKIDTLRPVLRRLENRFCAIDFTAPGWIGFDDLLQGASDTFDPVTISGEDVFYLTYSSGTTSTPKGIVLSHRSRVQYFQVLAIELGFRSDSIILCGTALYSTTTWSLLLVGLLCGATVIIQRKFDAVEWCDLADRYQVSHTIMVPAQYARVLELVEHQPERLRSLRMTASTGSRLTRAFKQRMMARFPGCLHEVYGMTEGMVTALKPSDLPAKIDSVGRPMMANDFRILDGDDQELPPGEPGEIVAYTPSLLREYFKQPDKTRDATWIDPKSGRTFLRSGDIGRFDEDGFLYLVDRKKDMIVSGGFNVYPADIERVLLAHPDIADGCVIGIPHETWGETPLALVIPQAQSAATAEQIREWVNGQVGKYQRVSAVEFRASFPRNPGGKILKRELRLLYVPDARSGL